jgi:hypothetical protein
MSSHSERFTIAFANVVYCHLYLSISNVLYCTCQLRRPADVPAVDRLVARLIANALPRCAMCELQSNFGRHLMAFAVKQKAYFIESLLLPASAFVCTDRNTNNVQSAFVLCSSGGHVPPRNAPASLLTARICSTKLSVPRSPRTSEHHPRQQIPQKCRVRAKTAEEYFSRM